MFFYHFNSLFNLHSFKANEIKSVLWAAWTFDWLLYNIYLRVRAENWENVCHSLSELIFSYKICVYTMMLQDLKMWEFMFLLRERGCHVKYYQVHVHDRINVILSGMKWMKKIHNECSWVDEIGKVHRRIWLFHHFSYCPGHSCLLFFCLQNCPRCHYQILSFSIMSFILICMRTCQFHSNQKESTHSRLTLNYCFFLSQLFIPIMSANCKSFFPPLPTI